MPSDSLVGEAVPLFSKKHAISVSLPTWTDFVGYKERELKTLDQLQTGYPRYWIHWNIRKLCEYFETKYASPSERCLPLRSAYAAKECVAFMKARNASARILSYDSPPEAHAHVHVVVYPSKDFSVAKQFWQHTGLGVSTRWAEYYLSIPAVSGTSNESARTPVIGPGSDIKDAEGLTSLDVLERTAEDAKMTMRRRIAALDGIDPEDVFLHPGGMNAIWSTHQLCMKALGARPSVCFGFPYIDTLKVLEKWGPGCHFFDTGSEAQIDQLERLLTKLQAANPCAPPILALYTEIPSNPLLQSVNLPRLRALADRFDFLIVIDDTIGNFANVKTLQFADIQIASLSKLFSGLANVMGGSVALNPVGKHYAALRETLDTTYEDVYFAEDAIVMEQNSRDFLCRSAATDRNADAVTDYLRSCTSVVKEVYHPKWQTRKNYDACRSPNGGYGGLFSLLFVSRAAAQAFFDHLPFAKGPSFGTSFTLVCPYAVIAHYYELDFAKEHGVPVELVRVWVGMEDTETLLEAFKAAVHAAEEAHATYAPGDLPAAIWKGETQLGLPCKTSRLELNAADWE